MHWIYVWFYEIGDIKKILFAIFQFSSFLDKSAAGGELGAKFKAVHGTVFELIIFLKTK